jgi:hypothetical protein
MWQTTELPVFSRWLWPTSYTVDSHVDQFRNQSLRPSAPSASAASGVVQSRIAQFSRMLPTWIAKWSQEKPIMTDDQVNRVVQHLCEQLHLALRLKDSEAHPPNAKDIGFDPASVRTVLLTGLRSARVTIHHEAAAGANEEPPWS